MNTHNLINNIIDLRLWAQSYKSKEFAFDTEFTHLDIPKRTLIGMSFYDGKSASTFIQFNFKTTYTEKEQDPKNKRRKIDVIRHYQKTDAIEWAEAKDIISDVLEGAQVVTANGKVEINTMRKYGVHNFTVLDDVNIMSWLQNVTTPNGLKENAKRELKIDMKSYEETVGMKVGNINWNLVDFKKYGEYGAKDTWATWELRSVYLPRMADDQAIVDCYRSLEMPLLPVIANAEYLGVQIDLKHLRILSKKVAGDMEVMAEEIYDKAGVTFNIGSPKQLGEVLFDRLKLPRISKTDAGADQTNEAVLQELAYREYDIAVDLLAYRKMATLQGTFIDSIPLKVGPDGRLRGGFNQYGTETGRMSSNGPNLQNIPNSKLYNVKQAFIPRPGYELVNLDYSTIEIRIMAHESQDKALCELLNAGRDIHQETCESVNKLMGLSINRDQGKILNFSVLFGQGAVSLAFKLNMEMKKLVRAKKMTEEEYKKNRITEGMAQKMIDGFYQTYIGFTVWGRKQTAETEQTGWVYTLGGRRRPIPELKNRRTWTSGKRKVINTIIQGGAGDVMKYGAIKLNKMFREKGLDANILLFVHDEYVIEVKKEHAQACYEMSKEILHNIYPQCTVPILCEGGVFDSWAGRKGGRMAAKTSNAANLKILKLI